jgi:hypothetical protein
MVLGEFDPAPWQEIAARRGIPLEVFAPTDPSDLATLRGVYTENATLIRSDHHIAWHGSQQPDDIERVLKIATGNALAP